MSELKRTPVYSAHVAAGARMVPFAGWEMPVQYSGIMEEHRAVRTRAGLFDVSHMGEFDVAGAGAVGAVQRLVTNDVGRLAVGRALYTPMCTPDAGVIDDLLVYRLGHDHLMLVVNAANTAEDLDWIRRHAGAGVEISDRTDDLALLALQGPRAEAVLRRVTATPLETIKYYGFLDEVDVAGRRALVSRTGYTGEDGFELYLAAGDAPAAWSALLDAGAPLGTVPAGLGARDTLRLEAGYLLHGNDMDKATTPLEVGLGWTVKPEKEKGDFIGAAALERQRREGVARRLIGFTLGGRLIARHGFAIRDNGRALGEVTSGSFGPTVEKSIGLGFVPRAEAEPGRPLTVEIRGRPVEGTVTKLPFYKRGAGGR